MFPEIKTNETGAKRSVSQLAHHYPIPKQDLATKQAVDQGTRRQILKDVICILLSIALVSRAILMFQIRLFLDVIKRYFPWQ